MSAWRPGNLLRRSAARAVEEVEVCSGEDAFAGQLDKRLGPEQVVQQRLGSEARPDPFEKFGDQWPPAQLGTDLGGARASRAALSELPKVLPVARAQDNFDVPSRTGGVRFGTTFHLSRKMLPKERLDGSAAGVVGA